MQDMVVVKLRKLLMMSLEKRILLEKIAHLWTDFGLPLYFRDTICRRYPQYFEVVATERGPALELTHWDPELAISAAQLSEEDNRARELEERDLIIDRPIKFKRLKLPKGLNLSKGEMGRISRFRGIPYISPYSDFSGLRSGTSEKEKHSCGVVHEILSLSVEKKTLVDHLTHFREEFKFSQQLRGMLIRRPDMFYVSLKGDRDSIFLREAYHDGHLMNKDRLLIIKEKLRSLVSVPRYPRTGAPENDAKEAEEYYEPKDESGDVGEWTKLDDFMNDRGFDDDDYEDDWSDEDNGLPPNFDEDDDTIDFGNGKPVKLEVNSAKPDKKVLSPDGRPRERW